MKNKALVLKIVSILMTIVSIRGAIFVFTDKEFAYAGLPMPLVYIIFCVFILINVYILWLSFIKKSKSK